MLRDEKTIINEGKNRYRNFEIFYTFFKNIENQRKMQSRKDRRKGRVLSNANINIT